MTQPVTKHELKVSVELHGNGTMTLTLGPVDIDLVPEMLQSVATPAFLIELGKQITEDVLEDMERENEI